MSRPVIILGGGGHARVVLETLRRVGAEIIGVACPRAPVWPTDIPYLGNDDSVIRFDQTVVALANGIGSIGRSTLRETLFNRFKDRGYAFATVVDPHALTAGAVRIGEGSQIHAAAVVQPGASIGINCIINTAAVVEHDTIIGDHCHLAPRAVLSGGVKVGSRAHIGVGAIVIQGIVLGDDVVVGAGAVVIRDVPSGATVAGVPARTISE